MRRHSARLPLVVGAIARYLFNNSPFMTHPALPPSIDGDQRCGYAISALFWDFSSSLDAHMRLSISASISITPNP